MRTITLLIAAAALAVGIISVQAQTVYSANVVGYVNLSLPAGYSMIANQLDADGTGTNNTPFTVLGTNLPANTYVYMWNGSGFVSTKWLASGKWTAYSALFTNVMQPHAGFFLDLPVATNVTLVGNVIQGTNTFPITAGYQVVAPNVPLADTITNLGYVPTKNDYVYIWNGTGFIGHKFLGTTWTGGGVPTYSVGQAMFLDAVANTNWIQSFTVQ
jgi:hypothetical protein